MKARIDVSPEMIAFVGNGPLPASDSLDGAVVSFAYRLTSGLFSFCPDRDGGDGTDADIVFVVTAEACTRIFGTVPAEPARWHMPVDLRAIALAIRHVRLSGNAGMTLRVAKSIELLCVTFERLGDGTLVPADGAGALTATEAQRIADARRLIDERWNEKLTLDSISRACGLNRAKLTRGFRSMFAMSVADAIADRRLGGARDLLLKTDLPVSSIGYRCGYLNNASFTRAFSRRYGQAPTQFRSRQLAA